MRLDGLRAYVCGVNGLIKVILLRFHEAENALSEGISICPSLSYNYGLRAYARLCLDDLDGAIEDCSKKIALSPVDSGTFALRGWAHYLAGCYDLAICDLEKAIDIDPTRRWYVFDCMRLVDSYGKLNAQEEIVSFCTATIKPRLQRDFLVELLKRRASAYAKIGQCDKALMDINRALKMSARSILVELYRERADVYELKRERDLAERDRLTAAQLQSHKAQMSEWIPASPFQRFLSTIVDGLVVGCLSAFAIFLIASIVDIALGGSQSSLTLSQCIPFILASFVFGFLDSTFVCLGPTIMGLSVPLIVSQKDLGINFAALLSPCSDPAHAVFLAVSMVIAVNFLYHTIMECSPKESTLGKAVLKLRVTDEDGCRLSFPRAIMRHLLRTIPSFLIVMSCAALFYVTISHDAILIKTVGALVSIFTLFLGMLASLNPGVHNAFAKCIVTDNHLYAPKLNLLTKDTGIDGIDLA